jgi:hypothetical protein
MEKPTDVHAEDAAVARQVNLPVIPLPSNLPSDEAELKALEKRVVRKVDARLMPVLVVMIILK